METNQLMPAWEEFYPSSEFNVVEETDIKTIAELLQCKMSCCWGQGRIKGTDYFALACYSAQHRGDKRMVRLCHIDNIAVAKKLKG